MVSMEFTYLTLLIASNSGKHNSLDFTVGTKKTYTREFGCLVLGYIVCGDRMGPLVSGSPTNCIDQTHPR